MKFKVGDRFINPKRQLSGVITAVKEFSDKEINDLIDKLTDEGYSLDAAESYVDKMENFYSVKYDNVPNNWSLNNVTEASFEEECCLIRESNDVLKDLL